MSPDRASASGASTTTRPSTPFSHLTYAPKASAREATGESSTGLQEDCLSCRALGTSACAAGAIMVLREIAREPRRSFAQRGAMGAFAGAFLALGAYRAAM